MLAKSILSIGLFGSDNYKATVIHFYAADHVLVADVLQHSNSDDRQGTSTVVYEPSFCMASLCYIALYTAVVCTLFDCLNRAVTSSR
jgi:hypothetical protein